MIDTISGVVKEVRKRSIVVRNDIFGFEIFVVNFNQFKVEETVELFTYVLLKEERFYMYGFKFEEERSMFLSLLSVSGIGPRIALNILSFYDLNELCYYIKSSNDNALKKIPGVTSSLAIQLIMQLQRKLVNPTIFYGKESKNKTLVIEALRNLQYSQKDINFALQNIENNEDVSRMIKDALSFLAGKKSYGK